MTGYNHYADCTCGWCVNYGRSTVNRAALQYSLRERDAQVLLKRNSANSISGCYVNPNAKCPVCSAPVFFYANEFGSRVFFDDLGPPWPKHPCTDNPRPTGTGAVPSASAPSRRAKGQMRELVEAANIAGRLDRKVFGTRNQAEWTMLVVLAVKRDRQENSVQAEFLDSLSGETFEFTCSSPEPLFAEGDLINKKGLEISFLFRPTLTPVTFKIGEFVKIGEPPKPALPLRGPAAIPLGPGARLVSALPPDDQSNHPMTEGEMVHYHSPTVSIADLFKRLEPVVKAYARSGTRKPKDVGRRLNVEGYRTAAGARWNTRLTRFLLSLMFNGPGTVAQRVTRSADPQNPAHGSRPSPAAGKPPRAPAEPLTVENMAERLARLGRVTVKGR